MSATVRVADLSDASVTPLSTPARSGRKKVIGGALLAAAILAVGGWVAAGWGEESTDNAFVEGHVVTVAARIPGQVAQVLVTDHQAVKAGQVLATLDDADASARLAAARAELAAAEAARDAARAGLEALTGNAAANLSGAAAGVASASVGIRAAEAAVAQAKAALVAAEARAIQTAADKRRAEELVASGGLSRQGYDAAVAAETSAAAALEQARAQLVAATENVAGARGRLGEARARKAQADTGDAQVSAAEAQLRAAEARVAQAQAGVAAAELQLSYTRITAPFDAVVAKRGVEVGQTVSPGVGLVGLVGTSEVWVMANFKETQIDAMQPGQEVEVEIDGIPGRTFPGKVEGIASATGARFSLLPPDNSSGNFTKVVQRVPVRIALPADAVGLARPGMSAVATVHVN